MANPTTPLGPAAPGTALKVPIRALLPSIDLEAAPFAQLGGSEAYALARMAGAGFRVWLAGSPAEAEAKARWLERARSLWMAEILTRAAGGSPPPIHKRLACLASSKTMDKAGKVPGSLAAEFKNAFPRLAQRGGAESERHALAALAMGCRVSDAASFMALAPHEALPPPALEATVDQARAEGRRLALLNSWEPASSTTLSTRRAAFEPEHDEPSWARVDALAQATVAAHGLGWIAVPDSLSGARAFQTIADLDASMELIERETGLGPGSAGLGGWAVWVGAPAGPADPQFQLLGACRMGARLISLGAAGGDVAFAHEWFHALDTELARESGALLTLRRHGMSTLLSESENFQGRPLFKGALGAAMKTLLGALLSPSDPPPQGGVGAFAAEALTNSHTRNLLSNAERDTFDSEWMAAAESMFQASEPSLEEEGFERLRAAYLRVSPGLEPSDFEPLFATFAAIKRPVAQTPEQMAWRLEQSEFFHRAIELDVADGPTYHARFCELCARAFESSFALDAALSQLGPARQTRSVSMVSAERIDQSALYPQGVERNRARAAFSRFFVDIKAALTNQPKTPAWATFLALEPSPPPRLVDKLIARRGDGSLQASSELTSPPARRL